MFDLKFTEYAEREKDRLKNKGEIVVAKIRGERSVTVLQDYILLRDENAPEKGRQ